MPPEAFEQQLRAYLDESARRHGDRASADRVVTTVFDRVTRVRGRRALVALVVAVIVALVVATPIMVFILTRPSTQAPAVRPTPGPSLRATISLSGVPGLPAVDERTGTLYVPIMCTTAACVSDGNVVDVINAERCSAVVVSECTVVAHAAVAGEPQAVAVDETTDTIYVATDASTTVLDGSRCNATVTSGCANPVATIDVGGEDAAFNPDTQTLYLADPEGGVHVIDGTTCNAGNTSGCGNTTRLVSDNDSPAALDIDLNTDTIYAVNTVGKVGTVSVIDGATCNGSDGSGCANEWPTVAVGHDAYADSIDQATGAVYVSNYDDGTVSVIDGARCNAVNTSGCVNQPSVVSSGDQPAGLAIDDSLHTLFVVNGYDDTLSAIDTRTCDGSQTGGCSKPVRDTTAGLDDGAGYNAFPQWVTLVPQTDTAYVFGVGSSNIMTVVSVAGCNAARTSGCRVPAPTTPAHEFEASVDSATNTIYASNVLAPEIDVLNGASCDATHLSECTPVAEVPMGDAGAAMGAIDDTTHTLYASDSYGRTVAVIDTATCNARNTAGCSASPRTITVGAEPGSPVLNPATRTLYVPYGTGANDIAVVDAATCNADVTSGCDQTPGVISVAFGTDVIAVSVKTDTIYAPNVGIPSATGDTVSVINGATCNGTVRSGCGRIATTVLVGQGPDGVAVDDATNTVYVADGGGGTIPGTLSIINSSLCNGSHIEGCAAPAPVVAIGREPLTVVVDTRSDFVYVADYAGAEVSALNGATCNAAIMTGCGHAVQEAVGSAPSGLAVDDATNTVFVMTFLVTAAMSVFAGGS
jgi:DNA-binding beta-propeller fold protein YncE